MNNNNDQDPESKARVPLSFSQAFNKFALYYTELGKAEKELTCLLKSSDTVVFKGALGLAMTALKKKDEILLDFMEVAYQKLEESEESNKKLKIYAAAINELKIRRETRNKTGGEATKNKYKYITAVAIDLTRDYRKKHPHRLTQLECARGVTSDLKKQLIKHFTNKDEQIKACIIDEPSGPTALKHIKLAFEHFGLPEYSAPRLSHGLAGTVLRPNGPQK